MAIAEHAAGAGNVKIEKAQIETQFPALTPSSPPHPAQPPGALMSSASAILTAMSLA